MSRHFYSWEPDEDDDDDVGGFTVVLGFDRPLQSFFMCVEEDSAEEDEYLYHNLTDDDFEFPCTNVGYFRDRLAELDIRVPESMFEQTLLDAKMNVGNRDVTHTESGWKGPAAAECLV